MGIHSLGFGMVATTTANISGIDTGIFPFISFSKPLLLLARVLVMGAGVTYNMIICHGWEEGIEGRITGDRRQFDFFILLWKQVMILCDMIRI